MNIKRQEITVRDLVAGYFDDGEGGVVGYGGAGPRVNRYLLNDTK